MAQAGQPGGCSQGKNFGSWSSRHGSEKVANSGNMLRVRQAGLADKLHVVKHLPTMWETQFQSLGGKIPWRRKWHPIPVFLGFPGGSDSKQSAHNAGDLGSIPGSPGEENDIPLQ